MTLSGGYTNYSICLCQTSTHSEKFYTTVDASERWCCVPAHLVGIAIDCCYFCFQAYTGFGGGGGGGTSEGDGFVTKDDDSGWGSGQVNGTDGGWGGSTSQDSSTWNGDGGKSRTFNSVTFTARGASRGGGGGGRGGFGRKGFGEFVWFLAWFYNHCALSSKVLQIVLGSTSC